MQGAGGPRYQPDRGRGLQSGKRHRFQLHLEPINPHSPPFWLAVPDGKGRWLNVAGRAWHVFAYQSRPYGEVADAIHSPIITYCQLALLRFAFWAHVPEIPFSPTAGSKAKRGHDPWGQCDRLQDTPACASGEKDMGRRGEPFLTPPGYFISTPPDFSSPFLPFGFPCAIRRTPIIPTIYSHFSPSLPTSTNAAGGGVKGRGIPGLIQTHRVHDFMTRPGRGEISHYIA